MSALLDELRNAAAHLDSLGVSWALVGGLAVSARAMPRTTRDIDVAVSVRDDADAESLVFRLSGIGYRSVAVAEQRAAGRLATARLKVPAKTTLVLDVLFASSGIEHEIARDAEVLEILPRLSVPVARVGHLMAMKLLARDDRRRPQDADDLRALMDVANEVERARCEEALTLIAQRGFHRDRDLGAAWTTILDELREPGG